MYHPNLQTISWYLASLSIIHFSTCLVLDFPIFELWAQMQQRYSPANTKIGALSTKPRTSINSRFGSSFSKVREPKLKAKSTIIPRMIKTQNSITSQSLVLIADFPATSLTIVSIVYNNFRSFGFLSRLKVSWTRQHPRPRISADHSYLTFVTYIF